MAATPSPLSPPTPSSDRRLHAVAAALALALGAMLWLQGASLDPTARDQVHDLSLALRIREGTALTDGNRHPLFPALLALFADRTARFFTDARLLSAVLSAAVAYALYRAAARVFGAGLALLSLLGVLLEVRLQARRICPEPLLAGLLAASASALATATSGARPVRATALAGALLGAAWLTKGSATLSLGASAAFVLLARAPRRSARLAALLAGFVAVASPLLAVNVAAGRSPLYNVNSAHVMWEDRWDVELDRRSEATPATWFARHGVGDAVERLATGLVRQRGVEWIVGFLAIVGVAAVLRRGGASGEGGAAGPGRAAPPAGGGAPVPPPPAPFAPGPPPRAAALPPPPPRSPREDWRSLALLTAFAWWVGFAWYAPIVSSRRLLFPIFPILLPPALDALREIAVRLALGRLLARVGARGARLVGNAAWPLAGLLVATAIALSVVAGNPWARSPVSASSLAAAEVLSRPEHAGTRVLVRPSRTVPPDWLVEGRVIYVALPDAVADADVPAWLATEVDLVLVNEGLLDRRPGAFTGTFAWDPAVGVHALAGASAFEEVWADRGPRCAYRLVKRGGHDGR